MENLLPDNPNFSLEQNDLVASLLPDAIQLLENDFNTSGIDAEFAGKIFGDVFDLRELIAQLITKTGGPSSEKFYRLLYRVDIPEAKIKSLLNSTGDLPFELKVAELMIIRALQKAYFRRKYKS